MYGLTYKTFQYSARSTSFFISTRPLKSLRHCCFRNWWRLPRRPRRPRSLPTRRSSRALATIELPAADLHSAVDLHSPWRWIVYPDVMRRGGTMGRARVWLLSKLRQNSQRDILLTVSINGEGVLSCAVLLQCWRLRSTGGFVCVSLINNGI